MRRRTLIIILAAVILGAVMAGGAYWRWSNSPRYALQHMALALKTKNMSELFKYLDLKAIINNFIDASSQNAEDPNAKDDEWTRMSRKMGGKFARMFLPKLFESFEKEIKGVAENYIRNLDNKQILIVAAAATTAQIEVQKQEVNFRADQIVGELLYKLNMINYPRDEAQVTLVDPKSKEEFHFKMEWNPDIGVWQVVSINYQDLKRISKRGSLGK